MNWYVVVARKRRGPLSTAQLAEELQAGKVPLDAWVWTEGMDEWVPAGEIQELRPRPVIQRVDPQPEPVRAPRAPASAPQAAAPAKAKPQAPESWDPSAPSLQQKFWNLLLRHWRGELPLPVSYWVMSLAATLVVFVLSAIVGAFDMVDAPEPVAFAILGFLALAAVIVIWQIVGVWRSAENYRARGGPKIWAQLAMGDGGDVLSIAGPIGFGLTARVDDALASFDNVRVVRLNSGGGRLAEAYRLGERIRDRGLSTHVAEECSSACVIAFASGAERLLGPEARIGLHEVSFPGLAPRWSESERRKYIEFLKGQGVSAGFVNNAMRRGGEGMWYPSHDQLIDAGLASALAEPGEFDNPLQDFSVTEFPVEPS